MSWRNEQARGSPEPSRQSPQAEHRRSEITRDEIRRALAAPDLIQIERLPPWQGHAVSRHYLHLQQGGYDGFVREPLIFSFTTFSQAQRARIFLSEQAIMERLAPSHLPTGARAMPGRSLGARGGRQ